MKQIKIIKSWIYSTTRRFILCTNYTFLLWGFRLYQTIFRYFKHFLCIPAILLQPTEHFQLFKQQQKFQSFFHFKTFLRCNCSKALLKSSLALDRVISIIIKIILLSVLASVYYITSFYTHFNLNHFTVLSTLFLLQVATFHLIF